MSYLHAGVWALRHLTGRYHVAEARIISAWLPPDAICFDVGAHGGLWTRSLGLSRPGGHVYAFEALPYYAKVLRRMVSLIGPRNVSIMNVAVSDKSGSVRMIDRTPLGQRLTGKSHVSNDGEGGPGSVLVPATTLDDYWAGIGKPDVSFVKCDVEGFELFVLRGAQSLIRECSPLFYNELNEEWCRRYGYLPSDIFEFFSTRGYRPYYLTGEGSLQAVDVARHVNRDVLFVPRRLHDSLPIPTT